MVLVFPGSSKRLREMSVRYDETGPHFSYRMNVDDPDYNRLFWGVGQDRVRLRFRVSVRALMPDRDEVWFDVHQAADSERAP